jgi:hypothetical protein
MLVKGTIHKEEISILNVSMPNIGALNFIKNTLMGLKAQIDPNTVTVEDLNTPLFPTDRP